MAQFHLQSQAVHILTLCMFIELQFSLLIILIHHLIITISFSNYNQLSGSIPDSVTSLTYLRELRVVNVIIIPPTLILTKHIINNRNDLINDNNYDGDDDEI